MSGEPSEGKITDFRALPNRIEFRVGTRRTALWFDERYLYEEWDAGMVTGSKCHLLSRLAPKVMVMRSFDAIAERRVKVGGALVLTAIVVFFSEYRTKLPLLTPALLLVGAAPFVMGALNILPKRWMTIDDELGNGEISIELSGKESEEDVERRRVFERNLCAAIEAARQAEYYE